MRRKITCILACVLIIATVVPSIALAASNAAILDKLTLSGVKVYDVVPTKGTNKTKKQIDDLLKKIPNKPSGKGNTRYIYFLAFERQKSKKPGNYDLVNVNKYYYKYISKTKEFFYSEDKDLIDTKAGIRCYIYKKDTKNGSSYFWIKGKKTGEYYTWKIDNYDYNENLKPLNFMLYPDEIVLGEKCMVYSFEYKFINDGMYPYYFYTYYYFISRYTGQVIKEIFTSTESYSIINTVITFEEKWIDKADSFFNPPKDVKFITN